MVLLFLFILLGKQLKEVAKEACGKAAVSEARKCSGLSWRCWGNSALSKGTIPLDP